MSYLKNMPPVALARPGGFWQTIGQRRPWGILALTALLLLIIVPPALAQEGSATGVDAIFAPIVDVMALLLFFKIGGENGFPFR
ncbi:hypothetical protein VB780_03835 [Leptolyngbya sp. CCNP1308]|uniref:hypothetical protein n=1 Tax=Leptolyngbya sp. CCNP1308 TaxID=3110255 RepID=UPI002B21C3EC|nr:hypothetical protein [Leptolyngbya sp. CCNP1308]MEA5447686.1 hypothetical protein [Leptolyngbya sp. CCNP1308]